MDKTEAKERFSKASALYRAGRFREALVELDVLATHFPRDPAVLDAKARTLEHLGQSKEALALYDRLVGELGYEKARPRRDRVAGLLGAERPQAEQEAGPSTGQRPKRRLRIKPIRLLLLMAIVAGMYFGYLPYWLGGGLIVAYFAVKYAIKAAFFRLLTIPFKMKGKALAGATAQVHGFEWTQPPAADKPEDEDEEEEKDKRPLRYVWIDVTITPPVRTQGFTHWEPGELALAPAKLRYRSPSDIDKCFRIRQVRFVNDGREEEDEGYKCAGPRRIRVLAGVPPDQNAFKFAYYFETFGDISLQR